MAKDMSPSKEVWEQLGFVFTDIPDDDVICIAKLPAGWSIKPTENPMHSIIFDENGMERGILFYKNSVYDRSAHMDLKCRYGVYSEYVDKDSTILMIYFGNSEEKLFIAGQVNDARSTTDEERIAKNLKKDFLKALAKQFGDEYYPGWENVNAYWVKEKKVNEKLSNIEFYKKINDACDIFIKSIYDNPKGVNDSFNDFMQVIKGVDENKGCEIEKPKSR